MPSTTGQNPRENFDLFFKQRYRSVYYFFLRRGFTPEESHDLAQDTFLNAYKGLDGFRGDASLDTWLFRIARNLSLNKKRQSLAEKKKAGQEISMDENLEKERWKGDLGESPSILKAPGPEESLLRKEQGEILAEALARLPPQRRRCLTLRLEGAKYREVAALLGISLQAVRSHLHQAKKQLQTIMDEAVDCAALDESRPGGGPR